VKSILRLPSGDAVFSRKLTISALTFMACCGLFFVLVQARPFWIDEWRVIYNLKYKSPAMLWGELAYMQEFPRVYIQLIKAFAAPFDYSYFTLRFPSFAVGTFAIYFCYRLMNRMYGPSRQSKYLFILIIFSCFTATEYYIQVKQYTMDILTSLIAIWQLLEIRSFLYNSSTSLRRYIIVCFSLIAVPFFSYTYPITILPLFIIVPIYLLYAVQRRQLKTQKIVLTCILLLSSLAANIVFYKTDVAQVMADKGMSIFWEHSYMKDGFEPIKFMQKMYRLFAYPGAGYLFEIIFGSIGIAAFIYTLIRVVSSFSKSLNSKHGWLALYSLLTISITITLYLLHKMPIEPRLNVYIMPSLAILTIHILNNFELMRLKSNTVKATRILLLIGVAGNIFTTHITQFLQLRHNKALDIYVATENAIIKAQKDGLPILITPYIAYPYEWTANLPDWRPIPGDWVLKAFPAYKVDNHLDVYAIENMEHPAEEMKKLPMNINAVMMGDGVSYHVVNR